MSAVKSQNYKHIIIDGLGWSGSSAVVDLLREYNKTLLVGRGLLGIHTGNERFAENRHLIKGICKTVNEKISHAEIQNLKLFYKKEVIIFIKIALKVVLNPRYSIAFKLRSLKEVPRVWSILNALKTYQNSLHIDLNLHSRIELIKLWLDDVINKSKWDTEADYQYLLYDHFFPRDLDQFEIWEEVFRPLKKIIVYRDVRDSFSSKVRYNYYGTKRENFKSLIAYQEKNLEIFKQFAPKYYEGLLNAEKMYAKMGKDMCLLLKFEDLVFQYDKTRDRIEKFVGLNPEEHLWPGKYFNPEWSKENATGFYKSNQLIFPDELVYPCIEWYKNHK